MSQQPPVASEDTRITIRHRRPEKWPVISLLTMIATFWIGVGCLSVLKLPSVPYVTILVGSLIAFCALVGVAALIFVLNPTTALRLGDDLDTGGMSFAPCEIERIVIAPDPREDYCDEQGLLRRIEVHFRRIAHHRSVGVIATESDADLTSCWAAKFGIDLVDCRKPPCPAAEVRA